MASENQLALVEQLQEKLLLRFGNLLDEGKLSPTDAATLTRLLLSNGWTLDPSKMPTGLRDRLTKKGINLTDTDGDRALEA